jgi:putative acetyltransferase
LFEVREELANDMEAMREVNKRAFGQDHEANIVDALRSNGAALLSLVATVDDRVATPKQRVVGHIMYSPATIGNITGAALGPMSVLPEHQRRGIGSKLVDTRSGDVVDSGRLEDARHLRPRQIPPRVLEC